MSNVKNNLLIPNKSKYNLSKHERWIYSMMNLPNTILAGIFELTYVNFFWDDLKLQQFYFALGLVIYAIVNSFNEFYLGRLSDRTNAKRWGSRRLIYIKWGGLLWAFVFFIMWFPWSYSNQIIIFIQFAVSICAFDIMLTLVWLVWLALLPEITENNEERTKIALLIQAMVIIGAFPVLLAFYIYESGLLFFQIFAGICALISAICYYIVGTTLKERPELYIQQEMPPLKRAIKEVLGSRSFVTDTIFRCFNHMIFSLGIGFLFAYVFILGFDILTTALLFYLNYTFVTFVGYVIYKKLSMKHEMRTLVIRGRFIQIVLNIIAFFILFQQGLELLIWVFLVINNIFNGYLLFDYPLLMLVTDDDEVINGVRREGLIMGMNAFFVKITQSLGPILGTFILLYFGFIQNSPTQSSQALIGIRFLMFIVISMLNLIGLISIYFFPLHSENLKKLNEKLLEIHNKKTETYKL